jgi:hypothetical protein
MQSAAEEIVKGISVKRRSVPLKPTGSAKP